MQNAAACAHACLLPARCHPKTDSQVRNHVQSCASSCASIEPEILQTIISRAAALRRWPTAEGSTSELPAYRDRPSPLSPHKPQPSFDVVAVLLSRLASRSDQHGHRAAVGLQFMSFAPQRYHPTVRSAGTADPASGPEPVDARRVRRALWRASARPDRPGSRLRHTARRRREEVVALD